MGDFYLLFFKDLRSIWRSPQFVVASLGFAILLVVVSSFSFLQVGYGQRELKAITPGIIWMIFIFTGVIGLNNSFLVERENDALRGVLLSGVEPSTLYFAKCLSNLLFLVAVQLAVIVVHGALFGVELFELLPQWFFLTLLIAIGFSALGTLLAAMAVCLRGREVILPLTLFPLLLVPLYAVVDLSREMLATGVLATNSFWFALLCGYDVIAVVLGWVLFEYLVRE